MSQKPNGMLDNGELTELHRVYVDVCAELGVSSDDERRSQVANAVMVLAETGERDYSAIRQRTKLILMNTGAVPQPRY
jgi:hypothetical protein